jgi:putative peptide zinc metalloprotease protein
VVLAALVVLFGFDYWLFGHHGVAQAFRQALESPGYMLLALGLVIVSAGWHEFGHAAGCAYGGARPGVMGAGIYLAYPAFYTDVTDSYRLNRRGKLRTDLAGVYFNGLFILGTAGLYALTHFEPLLLVIVVQHIEAAHQLLPFLRLDGYYILADATGVPDLFSRIKPILASALPWNTADPKVRELKPWVRTVVTLWVVLVVPLLLFQIGMILLHIPRIFATAWDSLGKQTDTVSTAVGKGDVLNAGVGIVQSLILILPILGLVLTFGRLGKRMATKAWTATEGSVPGRLAVGVVAVVAVGGLAYTWLPNGDYRPIGPQERGTLGEGIAAVAKVPGGRPSLVPEENAVARGAAPASDQGDKPGTGTPSSTSTTAVPTTLRGATPTTVARGSDATVAPAGGGRATTTTVEDATTTTARPRATTTTAAP